MKFLNLIILSLFLNASLSKAQNSGLSKELANKITSSVDNDTERLITVFKDLHQNPELGFGETRTAGIVAKELQSLGYEVKTGIGKTGVVGIMKNGEGPVVLYRADMDALNVDEKNGLNYASKVKVKMEDGSEAPVMHACGHDAHTVWLLSLAKTMAAFKDSWSGTLVLLAQPAEELAAGATAMVEDGLYTKYNVPKPDYALGLHTMPFATGTVVGSGGVLEAGTELLDVTFYGVGGHGSSPQWTKDPILMAAYAITQYQAVIARAMDPRDMGVITVGAFHAGINNNVIPEEATLKLNFRFFSEAVHEQLFNGVKNISEGIARTYGMPEDKMPKIVRKGHTPPLINDVETMNRVNASLKSSGVVNEKTLVEKFPAITGSEDFPSLYEGMEGVKAVYNFIGVADPDVFAKARAEGKDLPYANHQPGFVVDLKAIPVGAKVASVMAMELLRKVN
ncbi:hippurate hydrolase [Algoriphagus boseongensis]|uniref:Hippurate hydrolase n=1 Tax=Algoriphagus boseongensis TaxID=1442587 RepID=A0A4R6TBB9_9BACT|nr:amidohydrolase [Algoriphagus boseongensis]TDQ19302.1 hippurate hydrolase [Algoriphagus boseongensis]